MSSVPRHDRGDLGEVARGRHAAGGVVRRVQEDRPRSGIGRPETAGRLGRRTEVVLDRQRREHDPRAPPLEVGNIGRKLRAEHQHAIARVEHAPRRKTARKAWRPNRPRCFPPRPRSRTPSIRTGRPPRGIREGPGSGSSRSRFPRSPGSRLPSRAECWETGCRRSPARRSSLPLARSTFATASTVNAVSAVRFWASALSLGMHASSNGQLEPKRSEFFEHSRAQPAALTAAANGSRSLVTARQWPGQAAGRSGE